LPFLLDTNVAIHLRDRDDWVLDRVEALERDVLISVVTRVELEGGVLAQPRHASVRRQRLDAMLASLPTAPFDDNAADAYRSIVEAAGFSRRKVLDRMIAATALVLKATLVTLNGEDFRDVPGLDLLAWAPGAPS
jgi:predicted nucleic acid-binding protein